VVVRGLEAKIGSLTRDRFTSYYRSDCATFSHFVGSSHQADDSDTLREALLGPGVELRKIVQGTGSSKGARADL